MNWRRIALVSSGLLVMACASATPSRRPVRSGGHDAITAAELTQSNFTDAYQAVMQLRPEFLRRTVSSAVLTRPATPLSVYVDDLLYGSAESLRSIPMDRIRLIRYISSTEADIRWGGYHPSGAVLVTTGRP